MTAENIQKILKELDRLLNKEPISKSEINPKLLQGYKEEEKPTAKEVILSNLYTFFKKFNFLKDLTLYESRVQFWMPYYKSEWLFDWKNNSKALENAHLELHAYDSSEGYIIEII